MGIFRKTASLKLTSPEQLDELIQTVSKRGWVTIIGLILLSTVFIIWAIFSKITTTIDEPCLLLKEENSMNAHIFVSYIDAKKIKPQMKSLIGVYVETKSDIKYIQSTIISQNKNTSFEDEEKFKKINRHEFINYILNTPIEVVATLKISKLNPNKYLTTAGNEYLNEISSGDICSAKIIVQERSPIEIAFPLLKK